MSINPFGEGALYAGSALILEGRVKRQRGDPDAKTEGFYQGWAGFGCGETLDQQGTPDERSGWIAGRDAFDAQRIRGRK